MNILKILTVILALFLQFESISQIEVRSYPINLYDSIVLKYSIDHVEQSFLLQSGAHLTWDLNDFDSPIFEEVHINKTKSFGTKKGIIFNIEKNDDSRFYSKHNKSFDEIGFILKIKDNSHIVIYNTPLYFTIQNLKYGATFSNSSAFDLELDREELPLEIISKLPSTVTKIKLVGTINKKYHCDAGGRFLLNGEFIPALRLNIEEKITIKLYDNASGNEIPFLSERILKKIYPKVGLNHYFIFYSNSYKYYFAKVSYNKSTGNYSIKYQVDDDKRIKYNLNSEERTFLIYPNPTYNIAKMLITNYGIGEYKLELYNIIGKSIWHKNVNLTKNDLLKFDFSFLRKGTYILALKDKYGNIVTTRKIVIISI